MSMSRPLLVLGLIFCPALAVAQPPPVDKVVDKMQAFYEKTKDIKGKFKQVYTDTLYGSERTSYGYLYVKKPGMMRWNYVKPERKSFIADGKTLWLWEPEDKQAFHNPLSTANLSTGLTFLLGKGDLKTEFTFAYVTSKEDRLGAPGDLVLKLTPKKPTAQFEAIVVAIKPDDYSVGESMVVGRQSRNHFIFSKMKVNTRLSTARFRFKPPAGARVIDGAKLQARP